MWSVQLARIPVHSPPPPILCRGPKQRQSCNTETLGKEAQGAQPGHHPAASASPRENMGTSCRLRIRRRKRADIYLWACHDGDFNSAGNAICDQICELLASMDPEGICAAVEALDVRYDEDARTYAPADKELFTAGGFRFELLAEAVCGRGQLSNDKYYSTSNEYEYDWDPYGEVLAGWKPSNEPAQQSSVMLSYSRLQKGDRFCLQVDAAEKGVGILLAAAAASKTLPLDVLERKRDVLGEWAVDAVAWCGEDEILSRNDRFWLAHMGGVSALQSQSAKWMKEEPAADDV